MADPMLRDALEGEGRRVSLEHGAAERMFERRDRRDRRRRIAAGSVGLGLAAAVMALVLVWMASPARDRPAALGRGAVAGRYETRLSPNAPGVERLGLAGRYELRLSEDGALTIVSPVEVDMPGPPIAFNVDGHRLTTDLLVGHGCGSAATYRWSLADGALTLAPLEETCELRSTVLGSRAWHAVDPGSPADALQGEWTATYPCEEMVAAVDASAASRHDQAFWRRANAKETGSSDPEDPCAGSRSTWSHTLRFDGDRLQIFDNGPAEGFDGRYVLDGDVLTIRDPRTRNIAGCYPLRVAFGDGTLTFTLLGRGASDPWFVSTWQVAPFDRIG
jgi:hypothetical protein